MFPSQKYRCGQSSLEYLALAVFVMMGIIIGGPYVVRGINAHFKTLEEGALDSEREKIAQGVWGGADDTASLSKCDCPFNANGYCGDGVLCPRTQKIFKRKCNVLGCEVDDPSILMTECRDDPTNTCCDLPIGSGCGNAAGPTGFCFSATGSNWYEKRMCGSPVSVMREFCSYDVSCTYSCNPLDDPHAAWCNEAVQNVYLLSPNVPVLYRNPGGCTGDVKCEAQCTAPYITDTRYNEDGKHCCGGGAGGIIINGGPYTAAMQSDSFDDDGQDCIATPKDSKLAYPLEGQVYETITYVLSHAGVAGAALVNQSQTDVYAVGRSDYYWSSVAPEDVFFAIVSFNAGVTATFGVYDMGSVATAVTLSAPDGGVKYTGDGTSLHPYLGGKFTANTPVGFIYNTTATHTNFYSDPVLNGGVGYSLDPMLSFQLPALAGKTIWINTASGVVPMPLTADTYLLSFECNLSSSSDFDYNDTFILVTKIKPIP